MEPTDIAVAMEAEELQCARFKRLEFDPLEGIGLDDLDALDRGFSGECSTLERALVDANGETSDPATYAYAVQRETASGSDGASSPRDRE